MKIKTSGKPSLALESVALTDIVMNLFIFFFTSFSLLYTFNTQQESKIRVTLPRGLTQVQQKGETPLIVTVTAKNEIYVANNPVPSQNLIAELKKQGAAAKQNGVMVKADKQAAVDYFVKVLDSAKQAGIDKVSVSIELQKKE
jgi:biopolymer transport protein ExbD